MKLHPEGRMRAVLQGHDLTLLRPGRRDKLALLVRQLDNERMVAASPQWARQAPQNPRCLVAHEACFAMHRPLSALDLAAKAWPMHWCPRHIPRIGLRPEYSAMSRMDWPASFGVQGPGEMTIASGSSRGSGASLRTTTGPAPSSRK